MLVARRPPLAAALLAAALAALTGCANPGPPRPPSLHLPTPVRDLTAQRTGATVELHFTVPTRTTDELLLRPETLTATLCRQLPSQPCILVPTRFPVSTTGPGASAQTVTWTDPLPASLSAGPPRLLAYYLTLATPQGHAAGPSNPAWTAAGTAPPPITGLQPSGTRQGTLLRWTPTPATLNTETLLERKNPASNAKDSTLWLDTNATAAETLDTTALPNVAYQYTALRQQRLTLDNHTIDLRSDASAPITYTLRQIYPPAAPTGLLAAASTNNGRYAVDLVWQPVDDPNLAGYNLYRQPLTTPATPRQKLNPTPIPVPGFHDSTADEKTSYRYSVTAVGTHGNESAAATTDLEP